MSSYCPTCGQRLSLIDQRSCSTCGTAFKDEIRPLEQKKSGLFSGEGRISRVDYFWVILGVSIGGGTIGFLWGSNPSSFTAILILASILLGIWLAVAAKIKRCHDLGKSGWLSVLGFIPVVNIGFQIYMLFFKGEEGINRFGPSPGGEGKKPKPAISQYAQATQATTTSKSFQPDMPKTQREVLSDDVLYEQIGVELESNNVDKAVWTRAFAMAGGDDQKTRVNYINLRFEKLKELHVKEQKISFECAKPPDELVNTQPNTDELIEPISKPESISDLTTTTRAVEQKTTPSLSEEDQRYEEEYSLARQRVFAKIVLLIISLVFMLILILAGLPELIAALFPMAAFLYLALG